MCVMESRVCPPTTTWHHYRLQSSNQHQQTLSPPSPSALLHPTIHPSEPSPHLHPSVLCLRVWLPAAGSGGEVDVLGEGAVITRWVMMRAETDRWVGAVVVVVGLDTRGLRLFSTYRLAAEVLFCHTCWPAEDFWICGAERRGSACHLQ